MNDIHFLPFMWISLQRSNLSLLFHLLFFLFIIRGLRERVKMRGKWIFLKSLGDELVQIDLFEEDHPIVGGRSFQHHL